MLGAVSPRLALLRSPSSLQDNRVLAAPPMAVLSTFRNTCPPCRFHWSDSLPISALAGFQISPISQLLWGVSVGQAHCLGLSPSTSSAPTSAPRFTYDWGFVATSTASLSLSNWGFPAFSLSGPVVVVAVLFLRAAHPAVSVFRYPFSLVQICSDFLDCANRSNYLSIRDLRQNKMS